MIVMVSIFLILINVLKIYTLLILILFINLVFLNNQQLEFHNNFNRLLQNQ